MTLRLFLDDQPDQDQAPVYGAAETDAVALCLSEGLSCTAVAQRLGLPKSSLAKWVRQARAAAERFCMIETLSDRFSTAWLCRQLAVARIGYYAWRQHQQSSGGDCQER